MPLRHYWFYYLRNVLLIVPRNYLLNSVLWTYLFSVSSVPYSSILLRKKPASFGALSYSSGIIYRRGLNQVFLTGLWKHALQKRAQCPEPINNATSTIPKPITQF